MSEAVLERPDDLAPVRDVAAPATVLRTEVVHEGLVWDVRRDDVELADGQHVTREVLVHTGAVGVIALDEQERVLLVRQYRHPVGELLWEPPAGLLDVEGEHPLDAVKRELWEEAGYEASEWHVLADWFNSPGGSTEAFRCYLARGLTVAASRFAGDGEERDMPTHWLGLEDAVEGVLAGRLHNPTLVSGVLATAAARATGWRALRPGDAPWPERFPDPTDQQEDQQP